MDYNKYKKYKLKYNSLKNHIGGNSNNLYCKNCVINITPFSLKMPNIKSSTFDNTFLQGNKDFGNKLIELFASINKKCSDRNYTLLMKFYYEKENLINKIELLYPDIYEKYTQSEIIKMILNNMTIQNSEYKIYKDLLDKYIDERIERKIDKIAIKEQYFHLLEFIKLNCNVIM